jgi:ParB family chromosome partitioning protein
LGRGLEALLGKLPDSADTRAGSGWPVAEPPAGAASTGLVQLSVYELDSNPFQPRRDFDEAEINSLADSIREHGLLQPVLVRRVDQRYQLVAGERRLRAAVKAGWSQVPAQVIEADDRQAAELAIVENLQRKDLNALEKAASFQQYLQRYGSTQDELAARLQIDRSTVSNLIRLLELPEEVQQALHRGLISQGHARALLPLGDEREQVEFCRRIADEGLSVRAVETLVQETIRAADAEPLTVVTSDGRRKRRTRSQHLASLEQEFRTSLGTKVDVRQGARGRGRIVVHFSSHEEFERLQRQICGHGHVQPQIQAG